MINRDIGTNIKKFRKKLGLQANKLAEQLGISPSYLNLIESGKRNIDGDFLIKISKELRVDLSDLTSRSDVNLENDISELLDDQLFEDLDILGPEVKYLVNTNPKIARALIKLGDNFRQKDHDIVNKVEKISSNKIDNRKTSFPGEVISDFELGLDLDWNNASLSPWAIYNVDANSGFNSFKSGTIGNSQTSSASVSLDVTQDGVIEFYYRVSAEYSPSGNYFYDGLTFSINGEEVGQFQTNSDGTSPWTEAIFTVSAGLTEFTWTFVKDNAGGSTDCINTDCLDAAFIDDIIFPPVYVESNIKRAIRPA